MLAVTSKLTYVGMVLRGVSIISLSVTRLIKRFGCKRRFTTLKKTING